MKGKYIYGIIKTHEDKTLLQSGAEQVCTVPYQDISAVVADSDIVDYSALTIDATARYLLSHQQAIEKVMGYYSIIPVRLGTYASDSTDVQKILSAGYAMFKEIFDEIEGRVELDVAVIWNDLDTVIKEIGQKEEIKRLKEELLSRPAGITPEDQMRIGGKVKLFLDEHKERLASTIEVALSDVALRVKRHGLMDDRMILNAAFLVDKSRRSDFEKKLDTINGTYGGKIDLRCVGPLPPYSFYTAEVERIKSNELEWAKKTLCLSDEITETKIKKAYRALALNYHPDRMQSGMDRQFNEIHRAYKLLLSYIFAGHKGMNQGDTISVKLR